MIHLETKFLSSCESVKPDKLSTSKIQWWDRHRVDILIPKRSNQKKETSNQKEERSNQKEERSDGSQASPILARQIPLDLKARE